MLRRISVFLLLHILTYSSLSAADKAQTIVDRAVKQYEAAASISADMTISAAASSFKARITMSRNRFIFDSDEMKIWFDGKTQWTYIPQQKEIDISEPTSDELARINPFTIISTLRHKFSYSLISAGARGNVVKFTSSDSDNSTSLIVTFNATSGWPAAIVMKSADGTDVKIQISGITTGKSLSESKFRMNTKAYKGVEIVDLR